jgi:hypothetical protein
VFATLIGPYPDLPAPSEPERLTAILGDQLEAGLGLLTDGRVHAVAGRPGDVVDAWRAADRVGHHLAAIAGLEPPLIKACLVGPWTAGSGERDSVRAAAGRLIPAVTALFEAGAPVVQLTEPMIGSIAADDEPAIDVLVEVLMGLVDGVAPAEGHLSLALAGGGPTAVAPDRLLATGFASYLCDLIASPDDWGLCARVPAESGLIVGVVDARARRAGAMEVGIWGARYAASMAGRGPQRIGVCPGTGIERLDRAAARGLLAFTAEVARMADLADAELAKVIDPRAVDARSAALGGGELPPRDGDFGSSGELPTRRPGSNG